MNLQFNPYIYKAKVIRTYDGDTIFIEQDMGCKCYRKPISTRFSNVDTPEIAVSKSWSEEERKLEKQLAYEARDFVKERIPDGTNILIKTAKDKDGLYDRLEATIYYFSKTAPGLWVDLNQELKDNGYDKATPNFKGWQIEGYKVEKKYQVFYDMYKNLENV